MNNPCKDVRGAIVMEPQIVTKSAFKVAGYELKTSTRDGANMREIPAFWSGMPKANFDVLHTQLPGVHNYGWQC